MAQADAPLTQGFEDGAPAWAATGMWHVQANPEQVQVIPAIADQLVTLPDAGFLPAAAQGSSAAWFGQAATGTYCGADFTSVKQTPSDGCTSAAPERGTFTSPPFSLAGHSQAFLVFDGWWEIEAVNADIADLMQVEYSTDGGATWMQAGSLNPLDPAWGGGHQPFSDSGARSPGVWLSYAADLSAAAGAPDVRVRFRFDTLDTQRNGFRGLLLDKLAVVDGIGAVIQGGDASGFSDDLPAASVTDGSADLLDNGDWKAHFHVHLSHRTPHTVGTHWQITGAAGGVVATGTATVAPGTLTQEVTAVVPGTDPPVAVALTSATGAFVAPGTGTISLVDGTAVVSVGDPVLTDRGDGTTGLTFVVTVSPPSPLPITVDYTVTDAAGAVAASGTVTVPPGTSQVSTTVTVPAAGAPYTVTLSNASGGALAGGAGSATTAALQPPAGQLVLGVRQSGSGPTLGDTFLLGYVSGVVRYHTPGKPYQTLASGSVLLPFGTVVDARRGRVRITVEADDQGNVQSGEFYEGAFGVLQQPARVAVTVLKLALGDFSKCGASPGKRAHRSASKSIRHLWGSAKGRFRTKGRFASATVRGTQWETEDLCLATRITVVEGIVGVRDFRRRTTTPVSAGHSLTVSALQAGRYRKRRGNHAPRLSRATG